MFAGPCLLGRLAQKGRGDMKLARLGERGSERSVVIVGETIYDLSGKTSDIAGPFLEGGGLDAVRGALDKGALPVLHDAEAGESAPRSLGHPRSFASGGTMQRVSTSPWSPAT